MRVGIFVDGTFIPSREGATNRFYNLSKKLQEKGVEVFIFHCYRGWSSIELMKKEKFTTILIPPETYYKDIKFLKKLVKKYKIDIIQFNDPSVVLSIGARLREISGCFLVYEAHDVVSKLLSTLGKSKSEQEEMKFMEVCCGYYADHVICLTEDDKKELIEIGVPKGKISVVCSGFNPDEIEFKKPNLDRKTVLFLGNNYYEPNQRAVKRIHNLIYPVAKRIVGPIKFLIVGDTPPQLIKDFSSNDFIFTGPVEDLNKVFREASLAIAPIEEGSGVRLKSIYYAAAGLPIISTPLGIGGLNKNIKVLLIKDIKEFPRGIKRLLKDKEMAFKLSFLNRKIVEKKYSYDYLSNEVIKIYKKILK